MTIPFGILLHNEAVDLAGHLRMPGFFVYYKINACQANGPVPALNAVDYLVE
jgi:hypothetical protein